MQYEDVDLPNGSCDAEYCDSVRKQQRRGGPEVRCLQLSWCLSRQSIPRQVPSPLARVAGIYRYPERVLRRAHAHLLRHVLLTRNLTSTEQALRTCVHASGALT